MSASASAAFHSAQSPLRPQRPIRIPNQILDEVPHLAATDDVVLDGAGRVELRIVNMADLPQQSGHEAYTRFSSQDGADIVLLADLLGFIVVAFRALRIVRLDRPIQSGG